MDVIKPPNMSTWHTSIIRRVLGFLRSHPILCLFLLTPGIPEYISGSSPVNAIVLNPFQFAFQILANAGLYLPGVLLTREAMIRWKKGWATVLILGAAYGILEEGIALSTLYNPNADPVGALGTYGHWLGVNWVWTAGIIPVHMIFSISLPILLIGLALPGTQGRNFLATRKAIVLTVLVLAVDVVFLSLVVYFGEHFWMGWPVFVSSIVVICGFVLLAHRVPANIIHAKAASPRVPPAISLILGAFFYPTVLFLENVAMGAKFPAAITTTLVIAVQSLYLIAVLDVLGKDRNERQFIAFALGLILPIAVFGLYSQLRLPLVLIVDVIMVLFFSGLWLKYGKGSSAQNTTSKIQIMTRQIIPLQDLL